MIMIQYACKDMGLKCDFHVKGQTLDEVTKKALEHVREMHASDFNSMHTPAEIETMQKALARSTRVVAG
jgi:predicted small metal-binding protein